MRLKVTWYYAIENHIGKQRYCQYSLNQHERGKMATYKTVWLKYEKIWFFENPRNLEGVSRKSGGGISYPTQILLDDPECNFCKLGLLGFYTSGLLSRGGSGSARQNFRWAPVLWRSPGVAV